MGRRRLSCHCRAHAIARAPDSGNFATREGLIMKAYTAKSGAQQFKPSFDELESMMEEGGFCLACGAEIHHIEPDARKSECECCGAPKVYGAQELLIMGLFYHADPVRPDRAAMHHDSY
jgi:hypothetical protein